MNTPLHPDLGASLEQSRSGLRDTQRRSLMRSLFLVTGSALVIFGCLQILNGYIWLATGELIASLILFFGITRINRTPRLQVWIYSYLVTGFSFALLIMLVPEASVSAFVWVLMIPVLAYLLLGKREGFLLSAPFVAAGCVTYYFHLEFVADAGGVIDLLNMVLCAILMLGFIHLYETRREEAEQKLFTLAQTDALTGLANRANFQSTLDRTLAECARSGSGFALVIMDIDHFKVVNDTMGHDAGDHVLQNIGKQLTERLRITDAVGRLGGEEFGLILRDVKLEDSFQLMDELRQRIADSELPYGDALIRVTASFGIAHYPDHAIDAETLFRIADRCLFSSKRSGSNRVARAGLSPVKGPRATART